MPEKQKEPQRRRTKVTFEHESFGDSKGSLLIAAALAVAIAACIFGAAYPEKMMTLLNALTLLK